MSNNLNLKGMNDNNVDIAAIEDAGLYYSLLGECDFVLNIKDKLSCVTNNLKVILGSGQGVIQGHHFTSSGGASVTVEPNSNGYIVVEFDKSRPIGLEFSLQAVPIVVKEDLLSNGLKRQILLYEYISDTTSLSLVDSRNFFNEDGVTNINVKKVNNFEVDDNVPSNLNEILESLENRGFGYLGNVKNLGRIESIDALRYAGSGSYIASVVDLSRPGDGSWFYTVIRLNANDLVIIAYDYDTDIMKKTRFNTGTWYGWRNVLVGTFDGTTLNITM